MYSNKNKNRPVCKASPCWNLCKNANVYVNLVLCSLSNKLSKFWFHSGTPILCVRGALVCVCACARENPGLNGVERTAPDGMQNEQGDKWGKIGQVQRGGKPQAAVECKVSTHIFLLNSYALLCESQHFFSCSCRLLWNSPVLLSKSLFLWWLP